MSLHLTHVPSVKVGMLIRRPVHEVFEAIIEPGITTKFWYTKSTGRMQADTELEWTWEMYGASAHVWVDEVEPNSHVRFRWSGYVPEKPTTVEFRFVPWRDETTFVEVTEIGFSGEGDIVVAFATDSTSGFTFLLSSLKAWLEHDVILRVVLDAHPVGLGT